MSTKLEAHPRTLQRFLSATDANWRNSLYIDCGTCDLPCHTTRDYLYVPGQAGQPILLSVADACVLFGLTNLDKTECLSDFTKNRFLCLYSEWFQVVAPDSTRCPFEQALSRLDPDADW